METRNLIGGYFKDDNADNIPKPKRPIEEIEQDMDYAIDAINASITQFQKVLKEYRQKQA